VHRQGSQLGRLALAARRISARQIACQRGKRPAIAGNVMKHQQQHVRARVEREQMSAQWRLAGQIEAVPRRPGESLRQSGLADRHNLQPRPSLCGIKNMLARHPERVWEDGAQALVTLHQVAKRRLEGYSVERTGEPQRNRHVVGRARPFQAVQEPQPALGKRQRQLGRARQRNKARPHGLAAIEMADQRLHGGSFEHAADRDLDIQRGADAADQPRRQ